MARVVAPVVSIGLDVIPVVGNAKSAIEALTGRDLISGDELTNLERSAALVGTFTGGAGKTALKASLKIGNDIIGESTSSVKTAAKGTREASNILYRGERSSMTPERAFQEGFKPKGSHNNLEEHLLSNTTAGNFVSTSSSKDIADSFAGKNGYVYEINTSNYIDVNKTLGSRSPFPEQLEHSIPGGVKPNEIIGAHTKKNGVLTGEFIPNPSFRR